MELDYSQLFHIFEYINIHSNVNNLIVLNTVFYKKYYKYIESIL